MVSAAIIVRYQAHTFIGEHRSQLALAFQWSTQCRDSPSFESLLARQELFSAFLVDRICRSCNLLHFLCRWLRWRIDHASLASTRPTSIGNFPHGVHHSHLLAILTRFLGGHLAIA